MKKILLSTIALAFLAACNTPHGTLSNLITSVESYNKDLLFERYDIAAKKITPSERMQWLTSIRDQSLRFSEIDVVSTEQCTKSDDQCYIVDSEVQWYSASSPTVHFSRISATWKFDVEAEAWLIVDQQ